uniref:CRAL-TRIO domain-containing protein n=1 Tax=Onchocerca volvulus TaxID=6282 RepID=A0A2K6WBX0_ONCVO
MPPCIISKKDKEAIEKLRKGIKDKLTPYYDTDFNLLRWLQGHNYNFDVIIPKLKNHFLLRNSWDLDNLASKPRNHPLHTYWKAGLTGPAIKTPNIIVNIEQTGRNDYWGMIQTFSSSEIMLARTHDLELFLRQIMEMEEKTGQQASILYIMDLTDLKFDKRLLTLLTGPLANMSAFMSEHYVEMIHKFVLVNVPSFMATIWTIVKPLLPEPTRRKVSIFGSNWKTEIQNLAVPEVLPVFWNDDKIKVFKAKLELAQPLDPRQHYKKEMDERSKVLSIGAGKTGTIDVNVKKGSIIRWRFHTDGYFAFSILYVEDQSREDSNSPINIYPILTKMPGPTIVPIKDEIKCDKSGTYQIWFSNEHAWLHTLNIYYLVDVESENE